MIARYLRVSDEDNTEGESNSITGQRAIIDAYLQREPSLQTMPILEFVDDGYTGTNFDRPAVRELLQKALQHEIDTIVVKDFSRFGRNYIEVGRYLEEVFPFLGVRFISINDGYDSVLQASEQNFMGVAFQNMMYDFYSKDLSKKIIGTKRAKAKQGKFLSAYAPYGYQKTAEQQLIPDEKTAPMVQRIFQLASEGVTKTEIARLLNEENIPSPLMVRKQRGENFPCCHVQEVCVWQPSTITKILKDRRYLGEAVYGKSVAKQDCIVVSHTHEAIVTEEVFETVGRTFRKNKGKTAVQAYPISAKVRCGACKHCISRKSKTTKFGEIHTYQCAMGYVSDLGCYGGKIAEEPLIQSIFCYLRCLGLLLFADRWQQILWETQETFHKNITQRIRKMEREMEKLQEKQFRLYAQYKQGKWQKSEYLQQKKELQNSLEKAIVLWEETKVKKDNFDCERVQLQRNMEECHDFSWLDVHLQAILQDCISEVIILPNGMVQIVWAVEDLFADVYKKS